MAAFCQPIQPALHGVPNTGTPPLGGNAFEALELVQSFAIPEARRPVSKNGASRIRTGDLLVANSTSVVPLSVEAAKARSFFAEMAIFRPGFPPGCDR